MLARSDQGCQAEAYRVLYGEAGAWFQAQSTIEALESMTIGRVLADPRFAEALPSWAECMRAAGHPFDSPEALRASLPKGT
ncbi:hypothetical protein M8C13_19280 [Crossiella sp. SN42]|uniref:hypothetical protein n=1 Tax=Crossiella sp. SN42 TaxID=2944808 RepID=UPI00207C5861|nr:hypothetical protein [Crossiella sp. SN42]MCO1577900.1 hypothetical protein [Crossiella sp. SN42]